MAQPVTLYALSGCPYCHEAEALLEAHHAQVHKILVDDDEAAAVEVVERSGESTVPQVFVGELHIGGLDALRRLEGSGELDRLLQ